MSDALPVTSIASSFSLGPLFFFYPVVPCSVNTLLEPLLLLIFAFLFLLFRGSYILPRHVSSPLAHRAQFENDQVVPDRRNSTNHREANSRWIPYVIPRCGR